MISQQNKTRERGVNCETTMGLIAVILWPWRAACGFVLFVFHFWLGFILLPFRALFAVYKYVWLP